MKNTNPETLFHYCSNETFCSILESKTLRLSSMSLSNDEMEGKWFYKILKENVDTMNHKDVAEYIFDNTKNVADSLQIDSLSMCFSEDADLLSQWRGYAAEGAGVSIGIEFNYLNAIKTTKQGSGASLCKVEYAKDIQTDIVRACLENLEENYLDKILGFKNASGGEKMDELIERTTGWLDLIRELVLDYGFKFKNPAFSEEKEWRLNTGAMHGRDMSDPVLYRGNGNKIVPYRECHFDTESNALVKVILGPKNMTPKSMVERMLINAGFNNVTVERSASSLR